MDPSAVISFTFGGAKGMDGGIKRINAIRTVTKPSRKNSTRVTLPRRSRVYGCPFQIPVVFLRAFIGEVFISGVEGTSGPFRSLSYFREFICSLCESFGRRSTFISYLNLFTPTCYDLRVYKSGTTPRRFLRFPAKVAHQKPTFISKIPNKKSVSK